MSKSWNRIEANARKRSIGLGTFGRYEHKSFGRISSQASKSVVSSTGSFTDHRGSEDLTIAPHYRLAGGTMLVGGKTYGFKPRYRKGSFSIGPSGVTSVTRKK